MDLLAAQKSYFMDVDGRFRDIEEIERERNEFESMEAKQTQPDWIHDDGYRPKTERKFRPRPSLGYNRVPKEPLDYGSYDRSEHWRMMTELIHSGTLAAKFYESLSMPKIPSTKEVVSVCRENFTTSECFRYPDISRLRDTREKKFMKKYYHKEYPEFESTDQVLRYTNPDVEFCWNKSPSCQQGFSLRDSEISL